MSSAALRLERDVGVLAATLARSVRAGATLRGALEDAVDAVEEPLRSDVRTVLDVSARGVPMDSVLDAWSRARRSPSLQLIAAAGRLSGTEGGDLAGALDAAAVVSVDRVETAEEADALATQARTSAMALGALPLFGATVFCFVDPSVASTLFRTPLGWGCLAVGVSANAAGFWALRAVAARALR